MSTWLEGLLADFDGLKNDIDTALTAAGLPTLTRWDAAEPALLRATETPYGWADLGPEMNWAEELVELGGLKEIAVTVECGLVLAATSAKNLRDAVAAYGPVVVAAIETSLCPSYQPLNFRKGSLSPRFEEKNRLIQVLLLEFEFSIDRLEMSSWDVRAEVLTYQGEIVTYQGEEVNYAGP